MKVRINDIVIGNRVRKDFGDIASLAESIERLGLLQPIGITESVKLVFGLRRIKAYQLLGYEEIEAQIIPIEEQE